MKYVNLTGAISDLDSVVEEYIPKVGIHLEYTSKELAHEKELSPFSAPNPYAAVYRSAGVLYKLSRVASEPPPDMDKREALSYIAEVAGKVDELSKDLKELRDKRERYAGFLAAIEPFSDQDFNIKTIRDFRFIKSSFGRMPLVSFKQFEDYLYKEPEILFKFGKTEGGYTYGAYFVCDFLMDKYESVFSSMHFEKIEFPESIEGDYFDDSLINVYGKYTKKLSELDAEIKRAEAKMIDMADSSAGNILDKKKIARAYSKVKELYNCYEARKYAAKTKNNYFILVGWMTEKEAGRLADMVGKDDRLVFIVEDDNDSIPSFPPTKLKNPFFVRPFEFFTRMYGLPSYDEIEPTAFLALTYTLLFGIMFGDAGQGAIIAALGLYLGKVKRVALGKVMFIIGLSAMFFGALFGSVFGIEIKPLFLNPSENINFLLIGAIGLGMILIFATMGFNIANALKKGKKLEAVFDPNGAAGVAFYGTILATAALVVLKGVPLPWYSVAIILAALLAIGLRKPIIEKLRGKKKAVRGGLGIFVFEIFIEMFEAVLAYFTNTVSFVRVGAFAVSHASLMAVVRMLAGWGRGSPNIAVMIIGNLFVMGLEGLIVGIQVLRIEFYEIFSRFYEGKGREFTPLIAKKNYK